MRRQNSADKGFLLVIAALFMVVVAVLTAVYLSTIVGEKGSVDSERVVLQALNFAEGGANKVFAQLRSSVQTSLTGFDGLSKTQQGAKLSAYTANSLMVFNTTGVVVNATCALVSLNATAGDEFYSSMNGALNATATILPAENVTIVGDVYYFNNYTCSISSDARINPGSREIRKRIAFAPVKFNLTARRANFAKYALFTFHHRTPAGTTVWFTSDTNFCGPVHTNERLSFANNPSASFTNEVTQSQSTARFYNNGNSILLDDEHNGVRDVPAFTAGFERSQDTIPLPASVTQTELRAAALGGMTAPGVSSPGVYVPYTTVGADKVLTGGIYINGNSGQSSDNATVVMTVSGVNPVYTITQSGVITVNTTAGTTTVAAGGVPTTYLGKPDGATHEGIIIYSNDDIKSFSGTVQKDTEVTLSGERDIIITNDVLYEAYATSPTLNAEAYDNMLGILSWGGNVRIGTGAPDDVDIHAVVMAPHGVFTVDNYDDGTSRGTATLLGGVITDFYGAFGTFSSTSGMRTGYGRNFVYDSRVLAGKTPPYFPYMDKYAFDEIPTFSQRPVWKEEEL
jgi:hypothetical protein